MIVEALTKTKVWLPETPVLASMADKAILPLAAPRPHCNRGSRHGWKGPGPEAPTASHTEEICCAAQLREGLDAKGP